MCPERFRELMYKVVDGRATEAEAAELKEHLASCRVCAAVFERVRILDSLLREGMSSRGFEGVWDNVRRRVRARRLVWYLRVGAVAAAAAVLIGFLIFPLPGAHAVAVAESRLLVEQDGAVCEVEPGAQLPVGAIVRNTTRKVAVLRTARGSHVMLGVGSALRLLDERVFSVYLLSGQVRVKVNDEPLKVVCGGVEVSVCGTDFVVRRYGAGVEVEVFEGKVRFEAAGKEVYVGAGEIAFARWEQAPFKPERQPRLRRPSIPLNAELPEKPVSLSPQGKPPAPLDLPVPKPKRPKER